MYSVVVKTFQVRFAVLIAELYVPATRKAQQLKFYQKRKMVDRCNSVFLRRIIAELIGLVNQ